MTSSVPARHSTDTSDLRKARGAFFTPEEITRWMTEWAIRSSEDRVLEPSAGDAAFLVEAVHRLRALNSDRKASPHVAGVEIHDYSASVAAARIAEAGGKIDITVSDFFEVEADRSYTAVIGNPPYIRYQDWTGAMRARSRQAALRAGVNLTGLASSWAAFTVHSAEFLADGGRLGLVLPAELLSVNYAAPVRRFLFDSFASVELVLFSEQVFPEAEADVVLLLADGYRQGPTDHAVIRQARNASDLATIAVGHKWVPDDPAGKWTTSLVSSDAEVIMASLLERDALSPLETWGDTTLGMVTGNNGYFTMSPDRVRQLGLLRTDLIRVSPPGSSHLRGLVLSDDMLTRLGRKDKATYLFRPAGEPSPAAQAYIRAGEQTGVDQAYKCRVRKPWYRVPLVRPADLLLTCMNADTPRLTTNSAGVHHLNSVHGVYLRTELHEIASELLPLASLNSITLLHAEMVGRSYGGGILKLEPREADRWYMPSPSLVRDRAANLRNVKDKVARKLQAGKLLEAVSIVDNALLIDSGLVSEGEVTHIRAARTALSERRAGRAARGH